MMAKSSRKVVRRRKAAPAKAAASKSSRPGGRSARVRAAVLETAFRLLVEVGFSDLTIAAVAARSGVHETSIYRRWGDKTALVLDACLAFAADRLAIPDTGALRSDLLDLLRRIAALLQAREGRALLAVALAMDPVSVAARRAYWDQRFAAACVIIERAIVRGEIAAGTDPRLMLEVLLAPLYFRALVTFQPLDAWPLEAMIDREIASRRTPARPGRRGNKS
jgi:AcrR family transcriptional regulator